MIRLSILAFIVSVTLAAAPRPASAFCGFYVSGAGGDIFNDATQVVMMRFGTLTVLSMQNTYKGPPENFAMVVPVPVVLQEENVKTLDASVFSVVDQLAAPRLVEYWEQNPCPMPRREYQLSTVDGRAAPMVKSAPTGGGAADLGVKVEAQFKVGEYEIVILSATESTGLDTWLKRENYQIPNGAEPLLRPYVATGSKFFVAKVDTSKVAFADGRAVLSPLRFHYDTDVFSLPVRLGMMNSAGAQDLIVHILAPNQRYEVANYKNVTIPTNLIVDESVKKDFGGFYNALFDYTIEQNPGAVVTEYSWPSWPGKCDPCPGNVQGIAMNTLQLLGADTIGSAIANVDLVELKKRIQDVQKEYSDAQRAGAPTGELQRLMQDLYRQLNMANRRTQQVTNSFVLTRLHARYQKGAIGDDLIFRAAAPIIGGRGTPNAKGDLEERTQPSSMNNFQGRYAILHRWKGEVTCENPVYGRWGGPPNGGWQRPISPPPSNVLAVAERGSVDLKQMVGGDMPAFEYTSNTDAKTMLGTVEPGSRGCGCQTGAGGPLGATLILLALVLVTRRRR